MKYKVLKSFALFSKGESRNWSEGDLFETSANVSGLIKTGALEPLEQIVKATDVKPKKASAK